MQNTDYNEAVRLEDADSKVFITREEDFTRADIFSVDEVEIFEGRENRITMVQTYSKKFHCTYLLHNYPFDTQVIPPTTLTILYFLSELYFGNIKEMSSDLVNKLELCYNQGLVSSQRRVDPS